MTDPRASKPCGSKAARPRAGRLGLSARCCRLFGLQRRKTAAFPASRARCLRLAPWDPRWSDFSGTVPFSQFSGSRTYPPLWDLAGANAVGRCERICRPIPWRAAGAPGPHGLGRRDGWCVPPAAATAPTGPDVSGAGPEGRGAHLRLRTFSRPRVSSALERALVGRGELSIYSYRNFVKESLGLHAESGTRAQKSCPPRGLSPPCLIAPVSLTPLEPFRSEERA
jgi:hypothetical protein